MFLFSLFLAADSHSVLLFRMIFELLIVFFFDGLIYEPPIRGASLFLHTETEPLEVTGDVLQRWVESHRKKSNRNVAHRSDFKDQGLAEGSNVAANSQMTTH